MADTHLALANRALGRLGAQPITSLDTSVDTSKEALVISRSMESARRTALEGHRWNFAETDRLLSPFMCAPVYRFNCSYLLPSDYIKVHETSLDEVEPYRVVNHVCSHNNTCNLVLVTNSACSPVITYTSDITDINRWSPKFTEALEIQLAADSAIALGKAVGVADLLQKQADSKWRTAKSKDGQEGRPKRSWLSNSLLYARHSGGGGRRPDQVNTD